MAIDKIANVANVAWVAIDASLSWLPKVLGNIFANEKNFKLHLHSRE